MFSTNRTGNDYVVTVFFLLLQMTFSQKASSSLSVKELESLSPSHKEALFTRPKSLSRSSQKAIQLRHHHPRTDRDSKAVMVTGGAFVDKLLIDDYVQFHHQNRLKGKKVILRFDNGQPGLGDRMGSLLNLFIMASFADRILLLDWERPYPLSSFFFPKRIRNVEYNRHTDYDAGAYHCKRNCRPFDLRPLLGDRRTVIYYSLPMAHLNVLHYIIQRFPGTRISRMIRSHHTEISRFYNPYPSIFDALLRPAPRLERMLLSTGALQKSYISVHARLGKGVGEEGPRFIGHYSVTMDEIGKCFARAVKNASSLSDNAVGIFLATDTKEFRPAFEKAVSRLLPNAVFMRLNADFSPVHTRLCGDPIASDCINTILEFIILSHGKQMVSSHPSAFSRVAALIGNVPHSHRISTMECARSMQKAP